MAKKFPSKRQLKKVAEEQPRLRRVGSLVNQLMARRGYAQAFAGEAMLGSIIAEVGDQIGKSCSVGKLRAGVLQVYVGDSATLQELNFRKRGVLKRLQKDMPDDKIKDVRFRIQTS